MQFRLTNSQPDLVLGLAALVLWFVSWLALTKYRCEFVKLNCIFAKLISHYLTPLEKLKALVHFRTLVTLRRVRVRVRVGLELRLELVRVRIWVRVTLWLDLGLGLLG